MKNLLTGLLCLCLVGCYSDDKGPVNTGDKEKERAALAAEVILFNSMQTNWTMTIVERTNN